MSHSASYQKALQLEGHRVYDEAYGLFTRCLEDPELEQGDVLFHCGWCLEQQEGSESEGALAHYEQSLELTKHTMGRANAAFRAGWIRFHRKDFLGGSEMFCRAVEEALHGEGTEGIICHATYWDGVCLEAENRFIDAMERYRSVREMCSSLDPEARLREMYCLINIGDFEEAIRLSRTFEERSPENFSRQRYQELSAAAEKERISLTACLSQSTPSKD